MCRHLTGLINSFYGPLCDTVHLHTVCRYRWRSQAQQWLLLSRYSLKMWWWTWILCLSLSSLTRSGPHTTFVSLMISSLQQRYLWRSHFISRDRELLLFVQEAWWARGAVWRDEKNLPPTRVWTQNHPVRGEFLYWLSYPGHYFHIVLRLRIMGAIPPLPHIPSWRVQGKIYQL